MYLKFWNLTHKPFAQQFDLDHPFYSESYSSCRLKLEYLIDDHKTCGLLLGDVGMGKSFLLQSLIKNRQQSLISLSLKTPPVTRADLYSALAQELGFPNHDFSLFSPDIQLSMILQRLFEFTQEGQPVVILLDDAHLQTSRDVLLGIHLLLKNICDSAMHVHLILAGHYILRESLKAVPELEDRIDVVAQLRAFSVEEVGQYVDHRLELAGMKSSLFSKDTINYLHHVSGGSPRKINRLCDLSLLVACAEDCRQIQPEMITEVIEEVIHRRAA